MVTRQERIIWSGYSFEQEQVVKRWRIQFEKEMILKKLKERAKRHSTST